MRACLPFGHAHDCYTLVLKSQRGIEVERVRASDGESDVEEHTNILSCVTHSFMFMIESGSD